MTGSATFTALVRIALFGVGAYFLLRYVLGRGPTSDADLHLGVMFAWSNTALGWLS